MRARTEQNPETILDRLNELQDYPLVYACGDSFGASCYALEHNRTQTNTCAILIEFEVAETDLSVDGKDFLCIAFQIWDRSTVDHRDRLRRTLAGLYGGRILHYFDKAAALSDTSGRIGLCRLACCDLSVIRSHRSNDILIRGRHNSSVCSSFEVVLPVPPTGIRSVTSLSSMPQPPVNEVTLEEVFA